MDNKEYLSNEVKVSVCCITYNHEQYIGQALESFINQKTNFRYEILVNDDCSTDNTRNIIKQYVERYPDLIIPIFQTENQYSKNVDLLEVFFKEKIQGKYVAFCEGDDYWVDPNKLQMQVDFLEENEEYSSCVHNTRVLNYEKRTEELINESMQAFDFEIRNVIDWDINLFHFSSIMCKAKLIFNLPLFHRICRENADYPLALFMCLEGKVHYLPNVMSVYRYGVEGSFTKRIRNRNKIVSNLENQIDVLNLFDDYTNGKYREVVDKRIFVLKFESMKMQGRFRELVCRENLSFLLKLPIRSKIAILIGLISPELYMKILKIGE